MSEDQRKYCEGIMENVRVFGMQTENDDVAVESQKDEKKRNRNHSRKIDRDEKSKRCDILCFIDFRNGAERGSPRDP